MPVCNVSLQVIPIVPEEKVYPVVDLVIEYIQRSGVKHTVGPMETTMEGELDRLLEIVREAQQICTAAGAERILSVVKIDYSTKGVTIDEKVGKYRQTQPAQPELPAAAGCGVGSGVPECRHTAL